MIPACPSLVQYAFVFSKEYFEGTNSSKPLRFKCCLCSNVLFFKFCV